MAPRLEGRLVVLSGASTGIGQAASRVFVERGARVAGLARSAERLQQLSTELGGPSRFLPCAVDVTDAAAMEQVTREIAENAGLPDVVVANAGIGLDALFQNTTDAALRRVFDVNVFGLVRTVRPFLSGMLGRGSGRIVLVSSIVGKRGIPYYSAYSASKFALHGMADALRAELHGSGVSVGLVCPSSTASGFQDHALREGPGQRRVRARRHSVESVARAVVGMAESRRREIVLSTEAKLLAWAATIAPGLVDRMLARMLSRRGT